jgi:coenzyme F420-reducing hydrogenase delta subunit
VIYSGPIWANGIDGMAELLTKRLEFDEMPLSASQSVFSIFVEQMNNVMMYSAEKERHMAGGRAREVSKGVFIMGVQGDRYFVQSGNMVTDRNAEILKTRIDHLNTLDKKQLRRYYRQQMYADENSESGGAGIGLIEIARRAAGPIEYEFDPCGDGLQYFTMFATVQQGGIKAMSFFLEKEKTTSTPHVLIDEKKRYMRIDGRCFHEKVVDFFEDVNEWLAMFLATDFGSFTFDCQIEYFNSSTTKLLHNMLMKMDKHASEKNKIVVNWKTAKDNDIMIECGEDFKEDVSNLEFNLIIAK